jgi:hypothetical protein
MSSKRDTLLASLSGEGTVSDRLYAREVGLTVDAGDVPTVVGVSHYGSGSVGAQNIARPVEALENDDYILLIIRSQTSPASEWTINGFTRLGHPFVAGENEYRYNAFWGKRVTDAGTEPTNTAVTIPAGSNRIAAVTLVLRGVNPAGALDEYSAFPSRSGPEANSPGYAVDGYGLAVLALAGTLAPANDHARREVPDGYTLAEWASFSSTSSEVNGSDTTFGRTAVHVFTKPIIDGMVGPVEAAFVGPTVNQLQLLSIVLAGNGTPPHSYPLALSDAMELNGTDKRIIQ